MPRPLVGVDNLLELQENGYKSTVSAISEIADNSIQAEATKVDIIIIRNTTRDKDEIEEILIADDGIGMSEAVFNKALQMSSGTRGKAKSGMGKYGQGLPNSSISQTRRVEVYTRKDGTCLYNYIDLVEMKEKGSAVLPDVEQVDNVNVPILLNHDYEWKTETGTLVRWVRPNKVKPKTAKTLMTHIIKVAGRMFRHYLNGFTDSDGKHYQCKINVLVCDFNGFTYALDGHLTKMGEKIKPFDPMFLMENSQMKKQFPQSIHPTSERYPERLEKEFEVDHYGVRVKTKVKIVLSYCKKEERNRYGRNAGGTPFGKQYLNRNMLGTTGYNNISIVRAGREIDNGSFGFIGDVSDSRHRWWSAEIHVEPIIDDIIGIDNKKQQASEIKFIDATEYADADIHEIVKWISMNLSGNLETLLSIIHRQNSGSMDDRPKGGGKELPGGGTSEPGDTGDPDFDESEDEKRRAKEEFSQWLRDRYPSMNEVDIGQTVEYALSIRDHHIFVYSDLGDTQLYSYKVFGTKVLIEINISHGFYKRFIQEIETGGGSEKMLRCIRLLIGAMVNAEIVNKTKEKSLLKDRRNIRNRMAEKLDDYIEDLFTS